VNESYTSKTCGICRQVNSKLGGRKTFYCQHCKMRCDRDVNGHCNVLLRFLSESMEILLSIVKYRIKPNLLTQRLNMRTTEKGG